mmetsp:Transcript_35224/g.86423  ORF Transcript_35224/g.86423 Transcript_35224/m.86423 type:complete len:245 (+) Transcript_35224:1151-1885(+)
MADHRAPGGPPAPAGAAHLLAPKAGAHAQGDLLLPHCARHAARRRALHRAGPQGDGDPQPQEPGPPHQGRRPVPRGQERRHDVLRRQRARPRLPRRHPGHPDRPALLPRAVHPPPGAHGARGQERRGHPAAGAARGVLRQAGERPAHREDQPAGQPRHRGGGGPEPGQGEHADQEPDVRGVAGVLQAVLPEHEVVPRGPRAERKQVRGGDPGVPGAAPRAAENRGHDGAQGSAGAQHRERVARQ